MLRKAIMALLVPLLCTSAFADQREKQDTLGSPETDLQQTGPPADSTAVFVALPFLDGAEGTFEIEVGVYLDGTRTFFETMTAEGSLEFSGPTALSLLASVPEMRESLLSLVEGGEIQVDFRVDVEGWDSLWVSLEDLMDGSQDLLGQEFRPLDLRFEVEPSGTIAEAAGSGSAAEGTPETLVNCELLCEQQYFSCLLQNGCQIPVQGPSERGFDNCAACATARTSCILSCDPPPSCPTVTEFVESDLITQFSSGPFCLASLFFPNQGDLYVQLYLVYEHRRIRRTVACNGSVTEVVLQIWNTTNICQTPLFSPCSFPGGYPNNVCL